MGGDSWSDDQLPNTEWQLTDRRWRLSPADTLQQIKRAKRQRREVRPGRWERKFTSTTQSVGQRVSPKKARWR